MPRFLFLVGCLLLASTLPAQSPHVAVLVTGNPTTFTPHVQIECGDKKVGTLTSGEYIVFDSFNARSLSFYRRGNDDIEIPLPTLADCFIVVSFQGATWKAVRKDVADAPDYIRTALEESRQRAAVHPPESNLVSCTWSGTAPPEGTKILVTQNDTLATCPHLKPLKGHVEAELMKRYSLVQRSDMPTILSEQRLQMTGLLENHGNAGNIATAEYVVSIDFECSQGDHLFVRFVRIDSGIMEAIGSIPLNETSHQRTQVSLWK
jgi:hypothetical protein